MPSELGKAASAISGHSAFETARAPSVVSLPKSVKTAHDQASHHSGTGLGDEKKQDNFEEHGANKRLPPPPMGHTPSLSGMRSPAPSYHTARPGQAGSVAGAKAAQTPDATKPSVFARFGGAIKTLLSHPNKMHIACLIGGALSLAVGIASGNPLFIMLGIALVVGGIMGVMTSDPQNRPVAAPQFKNDLPSGPGPAPADTSVTREEDAAYEATLNKALDKKVSEHQEATSPTAQWARDTASILSEDDAELAAAKRQWAAEKSDSEAEVKAREGSDANNDAASVASSRRSSLSVDALKAHTEMMQSSSSSLPVSVPSRIPPPPSVVTAPLAPEHDER